MYNYSWTAVAKISELHVLLFSNERTSKRSSCSWSTQGEKTIDFKSKDKEAAPPSSKLKVFNLVTFKLHALGDYARTIRWFGTSDSYSTQPVRCLKNINISRLNLNLKRVSLSIVVSRNSMHAPTRMLLYAR